MDVQNFIIGEQSFQGIGDLGDTLERQKAQKAEEERRLKAGQAASTKYLDDLLSEENFLTGDMHDPYRNINIQQLKQEGLELIKQGADTTSLAMALSPKVNRLSQETQVLKAMQRQKQEARDKLKNNPAINIDAFDNAFKDIYFEVDEKGNRRLKNIKDLDPTKNYVDEILNTKQVYTPAGVEEYLRKAQLNTVGESAIITDARGGSRSAKLDVSKPNFMQLNVDATGKLDENEKFIPKYEIAKDGDSPIIAQFKTKQGKDEEAPLRVLEQSVFENLMLNKDAAAYIMQEARQAAQDLGVPISDTKVETFARAIAYDLFKGSTQHRSTYKEAEAKKDAPAPKTIVNIRTGGGKGDVEIDDAWEELEATMNNYKPGELVPIAEAPQVLFDELLKKGKSGSIMAPSLNSGRVFLQKEGNDTWVVIRDMDNKQKKVLKLQKVATNRKANPQDKGTQQKIIKEGQGGGTPAPNPTNKKLTLAEQMRKNAAKNKPK